MFGSHFEWRWCCGPTPVSFWEKLNSSTVTDRQRETGEVKVQQDSPPPESKRLSIIPFQTRSTKQSQVAQFGITRLERIVIKDDTITMGIK